VQLKFKLRYIILGQGNNIETIEEDGKLVLIPKSKDSSSGT
jgi:hypothetical protein